MLSKKNMLPKKYAVWRRDITTTIFLLFSLFPKGTPFKCRKHPLVFCQRTVFMMLFQHCLTSGLFPISNSSRSGWLSPKAQMCQSNSDQPADQGSGEVIDLPQGRAAQQGRCDERSLCTSSAPVSPLPTPLKGSHACKWPDTLLEADKIWPHCN